MRLRTYRILLHSVKNRNTDRLCTVWTILFIILQIPGELTEGCKNKRMDDAAASSME